MLLRARHFQFQFPRPTMLMGIVNVTPDSFSDGGRHLAREQAVAHALRLAEEGADIIDLGGESTRPDAAPVPEMEELCRVLPVIEELTRRGFTTPLSIDTMKPAVARAAVQAGAVIINDVAASRSDPAMWRVVAETGAAYVAMHMQGTPATMQLAPHYRDALQEVDEFLADRLVRLADHGVKPEQVVLDPGIGFGKTVDHNLELLAGVRHFTRHGRPVLVGASRKAFIGRVTGAGPAAERLAGSLACACAAVSAGASIVRVHDVRATTEAVRMTEAIEAQRRH